MQARRFLVIVAAMWVSWFDFGLQTTLGTLLLSILEQVGEDRSTAASVQSLFVAVNQCFGVISGLLVKKFGIPKISLTGSILLPLGFFLSYFATSVFVINICVGVISAAGVSLMFVSSIAMVKEMFSGKGLPMAMALQSVSVSLAGLSYPFAINFLLKKFGLNDTFLILSGYLLNNVVVSVFFTYTLKVTEKSCVEKKETLKVNTPGGKNSLHEQESSKKCELDEENNAEFSRETEPSKQTEPKSTNIALNHKTDVRITNETTESTNEQKGFDNTIYEADDGDPNDIITSQPKAKQKQPNRRLFVKPLQFLSSDCHFSVAYFTILVGTGLAIGCQNGYLTLLMDVFQFKGYTEKQGLMAFLPLNICGLLARLLPGLIDLRLGLNVRHDIILASVFSLCGSLGQLLILYSTNYIMIMSGVGVTGIPMGGVISAASILVAQIVTEKNFPVAFGLLLTVVGLLASCFGPVYAAGVSLMFVSSIAMVKEMFSGKGLPMAMALQSVSVSLAGLSYPFAINFLLKKFGLNDTFLILSGYLLNNVVVSVFFTYTLKVTEKSCVEKKETLKVNTPGGKNSLHEQESSKKCELDEENNAEFSRETEPSKQTEPKSTNIALNHKTDVRITNETTESTNEQKGFDNTIYEADDGDPNDIITSQPKAKQKQPNRRLFVKPLQFLSSDCHFSVAYFTILVGTGLAIGCQNGYLTLLMDVFQFKGYTEKQGLMAFLPLNICGLLARLLPGLIDLRLGLNVRHDIILASVFSLCGSLGQLLILYSTNYIMIMSGVGVTGIPMGGVISAASILVAQIVTEKNFPVAFGLLLTVVGLLASCFGPVYGTIRDIHGSYSPVLTISACLQFTGAVLFLCALCDKKRTKVPSKKGMTIQMLARQLHGDFDRFVLRAVPF